MPTTIAPVLSIDLGDARERLVGHRLYGLVEGRLLWTFDMAAVGQPLGNHLAATLSRADATE